MSVTVNAALLSVQFDSVSSAGAVSVPGLEVGDVMLSLNFVDTGSPNSPATPIGNGWFEGVVSVANELQQQVSMTSGTGFNAVFARLG